MTNWHTTSYNTRQHNSHSVGYLCSYLYGGMWQFTVHVWRREGNLECCSLATFCLSSGTRSLITLERHQASWLTRFQGSPRLPPPISQPYVYKCSVATEHGFLHELWESKLRFSCLEGSKCFTSCVLYIYFDGDVWLTLGLHFQGESSLKSNHTTE